MSDSLLVTYATRYGSTREVAEAIADVLREHGLAVEVKPVGDVHSINGYEAVVLGAPLFMFHWHKGALRFLSRYQKLLSETSVAIFALGPTHVPHDEQEWQDSRSQLDKELALYPWLKPIDIGLFGGRYDPSKLNFPLSLFIGNEPATDIRDWKAIRSWAARLAVERKPIRKETK